MDDDFVYLYIDSSQKLKIYILDNLESQFRILDQGLLTSKNIFLSKKGMKGKYQAKIIIRRNGC